MIYMYSTVSLLYYIGEDNYTKLFKECVDSLNRKNVRKITTLKDIENGAILKRKINRKDNYIE